MKILYYIYNKIKNNKTMTRKERKKFILNLDKVVKSFASKFYNYYETLKLFYIGVSVNGKPAVSKTATRGSSPCSPAIQKVSCTGQTG